MNMGTVTRSLTELLPSRKVSVHIHTGQASAEGLIILGRPAQPKVILFMMILRIYLTPSMIFRNCPKFPEL